MATAYYALTHSPADPASRRPGGTRFDSGEETLVMTNEINAISRASSPQGPRMKSPPATGKGTGDVALTSHDGRLCTGISDLVLKADSTRLGAILEALTADLDALLQLRLQYKVSEWMIQGRNWYIHHRSTLVRLGRATSRSVDLVAEQIVALGGWPAPSPGAEVFQAEKAARSVRLDPGETLSIALRMERDIVDRLDGQIQLAVKEGDPATRDLFSHLQVKHTRHVDELVSVQNAEFRLSMTAN